MTTVEIDLARHRSQGSHLLSGRDRGISVRADERLDDRDREKGSVTVAVPEDIYSINTSFFLGLFGPSVRKLGSREAFLGHYKFVCTPLLLEDVERGIREALKKGTPL